MRKKLTERGESVGLLEPEQFNGHARPKMYAERADIPDPVLEETANAEAGGSFLRARQRVPVRRRGGSRFASRFSWKSRWGRLTAVLIAAAGLGLLAAAIWGTKSFLRHSPYFQLASTADIQVAGNRVVTDRQVLAFFAPDVGRSIFRVPLAERQAQLAQVPWVWRATVMRLWPNRLRVNVLERKPVAFVRDGNTIRLVDDEGVLLNLPAAAAQHYSFPILNGISSAEPLSTRAAQVELYRRFIQALDADGSHISSTVSEVDLSDVEDVRAIFTGGARQPLVHFGVSDFLPRYQAYRAHLAGWLQQYPQLRSVDMRYGRQVVLDTGTVAEASAAQETDLSSRPERSGVEGPAVSAVPSGIGLGNAGGKSARATSTSRTHAAKSKRRTGFLKKSAAAKHRVASRKRTTRAPERGHPVRHPIMHIVSGM